MFGMKTKLLQMDYSYAGPWGDEMSTAYTGLAERITDESRSRGQVLRFDDHVSIALESQYRGD
jgi:hypothetical protein